MNYHENTRINLIIKTLLNKKGLDILLMDLRGLSDSADFFILCTGTSDQHVKSLSESKSPIIATTLHFFIIHLGILQVILQP